MARQDGLFDRAQSSGLGNRVVWGLLALATVLTVRSILTQVCLDGLVCLAAPVQAGCMINLQGMHGMHQCPRCACGGVKVRFHGH